MSLIRSAAELGLTPEVLQAGLALLAKPRKIVRHGKIENHPPAIVVENGRVARDEIYHAEMSIAVGLDRLLARDSRLLELPDDLWADFTPDEGQKQAIDAIAASNIVVLTGGPGTGKSALTRKAVEVFRHAGLQVLQVAPTGRAAKVLAQRTGFPAKTIHRALGRVPVGNGWLMHAGNKFPASVVVVDEVSMVSVNLFASLLDAIKTGARLLIVGDVDQLPSVDPGRVLFDIIQSAKVPVARLTKIFRQASESRIPYVARDINNGRLPENLAGEGTDVRFVERSTPELCVELVLAAVAPTGIPAQKKIDARDIQVIVPQKNHAVGVEALNIALQTALNPATDNEMDIPIGNNYFTRKGDRVLHVENNYDLDVMNGDLGFVLDSNPDGLDLGLYPEVRTSEDAEAGESGDEDEFGDIPPAAPHLRTRKHVLVVEFDDGTKQVAYNKQEARELRLGYAVTVHKFQGSQSPAVIFIAHPVHQFMLTRANVYTALTRASKYVLIIGSANTLARAASNTRGAERRTQLRDFMQLPRTSP